MSPSQGEALGQQPARLGLRSASRTGARARRVTCPSVLGAAAAHDVTQVGSYVPPDRVFPRPGAGPSWAESLRASVGPQPCARSPRWTQKLLEIRFTALPVSGQARSTMGRFRRNISVLLLSDRSPNQEARGSMKTQMLEATLNREMFVLPEDSVDFSRVPAAPHSPAERPFPLRPRVRATLGAGAE